MKQKLLVVLIASALTGCGGGGGDSSNPSNPPQNPTNPPQNPTNPPPPVSGNYNLYFQSNILDRSTGSFVTARYVSSSMTKEAIESTKIAGQTIAYNDAKGTATVSGNIPWNYPKSNVSLNALGGSNGNEIRASIEYPLKRAEKVKGYMNEVTGEASVFSKEAYDGNPLNLGGGEDGFYLSHTAGLYNEGTPQDYFKTTMPSTNMDKATKDGTGVNIAVIEVGFDKDHPIMKRATENNRWLSSDTFSYLYQNTNSSESGNHGVGVFSAVNGEHKLVAVDDVFLREYDTGAGDYVNTKKITGNVFSQGFGTAPNANVFAVEDLPNLTISGNPDKGSFLSDFAWSLLNNSSAQSMLSGLQVANISAIVTNLSPNYEAYMRNIKALQSQWLGGKGLNIVVGAGNGFETPSQGLKRGCITYKETFSESERDSISCETVAENILAFSPYTIAVGAVDSNEVHASYSSTGSALWVSAPGNQWLATNNKIGAFQIGTSYAAPFVSGVVGQMLQANPNLSWRDVRHLIAKNAVKYDPSHAPLALNTDFGSIKTQKGWVTNAAGFSHNTYYGFGGLDVVKLVSEASKYTNHLPPLQESPYVAGTLNAGSEGLIVEGLTPTVASFTVDGSIGTAENIIVKIKANSAYSFGFYAELTSPQGTKATVVDVSQHNILGEFSPIVVTANAFYGENPTGEWTLKLYDLKKDFASFNTKINVKSVELKVLGR